MNELKVCPFCGAAAILRVCESNEGRWWSFIYCVNCDVEMEHATELVDSEDAARQMVISKWNKRIEKEDCDYKHHFLGKWSKFKTTLRILWRWYIKGQRTIDLTAAAGAGFEPSCEWCDKWLRDIAFGRKYDGYR